MIDHVENKKSVHDDPKILRKIMVKIHCVQLMDPGRMIPSYLVHVRVYPGRICRYRRQVTVPALTVRDQSTRILEAKLNTTLQVPTGGNVWTIWRLSYCSLMWWVDNYRLINDYGKNME